MSSRGHATRHALCWQPRRETWLALVSTVLLLIVYRGSTLLAATNPLAAETAFLALGGLVTCTLIPLMVLRRASGGSSAELGITRVRLVPALLISVVFALGSSPALFTQASTAGVPLAPHVTASLLNLWEPLFVYGWLQMRFEDAFGYVPAPLVAGACLGVYHLGSVPLDQILGYLVWGTTIGVLFAFTRNLFAVFPFAWGVAGAIGAVTVAPAGWIDALAAVVLLGAQVVVLLALLPRRESSNPGVNPTTPCAVDSSRERA